MCQDFNQKQKKTNSTPRSFHLFLVDYDLFFARLLTIRPSISSASFIYKQRTFAFFQPHQLNNNSNSPFFYRRHFETINQHRRLSGRLKKKKSQGNNVITNDKRLICAGLGLANGHCWAGFARRPHFCPFPASRVSFAFVPRPARDVAQLVLNFSTQVSYQ